MAKNSRKLQNDKKQDFVRVNERIKFSPVLLIDQNGQNLGAIPVDRALRNARSVDLDLVEVSPHARPPVCRIMDFGKYRYEQSQKEKKQKQKSKSQSIKEVRLSPRIEEHDIVTKANAAKRFLDDGHKVQFKLEYKKRENAHKDFGFDVVDKMLALLKEAGCPISKPKLEGRFLMCLVEPINGSEQLP